MKPEKGCRSIQQFNVCVSRLLQKVEDTGGVVHKKRAGCPRKICPDDDEHLLNFVRDNPFATGATGRIHLQQATRINMCEKTVRR